MEFGRVIKGGGDTRALTTVDGDGGIIYYVVRYDTGLLGLGDAGELFTVLAGHCNTNLR